MPGVVYIIGGTYDTLSVTRRAHNGLHHTRHAYLFHGSFELLAGRGKPIGRGGQTQLLGSQTAYAFTVHRQVSGRSRRGNRVALFLESHQRIGSNSLYLGNNVIGAFLLNHFAQFLTVEHRQHVAAMSYLHGRSIGIFIQRNHLYTIALQLDCNLFS